VASAFECGYELSGFIKCGEISLLAGDRLAYYEWLCSTEVFSQKSIHSFDGENRRKETTLKT